MELRTLAYVEAVARLGRFTRAAEELHVAQPAVSAQVAGLEREAGVRLFVRSRRGARATEAGERVVARARRVLAEVDHLRADVDDLRGLVSGRVRIGTTLLVAGLDVPGTLAAFRTAHPGVRVHVTSGLIADLRDGLAKGDLDLVLGPLEQTEGFRAITLTKEHLVLLVPPKMSPVPRRLADVADQPFICLGPTSGLAALLADAAREAGFVPDVQVEAAGPQQIREFVAAGIGVALLAASLAADGAARPVQVVELDPPLRHPPLGVFTTAGDDPSPAASAFLALVVARARSSDDLGLGHDDVTAQPRPRFPDRSPHGDRDSQGYRPGPHRAPVTPPRDRVRRAKPEGPVSTTGWN